MLFSLFRACFPQGHLDSLRKSILFQHKLRNSRALIVDLHKCSQMSQSKHRAQRQPCPDSCRCINKIHAAVKESIKQRRVNRLIGELTKNARILKTFNILRHIKKGKKYVSNVVPLGSYRHLTGHGIGAFMGLAVRVEKLTKCQQLGKTKTLKENIP